MDMLSVLKSLERALQSWVTKWYADFNVLPYCGVPTSRLPWLSHIVGPGAKAFTSALQFPTPVFAKAHVLFWMPLLAVRQAIKQAAEMHPFPLLARTGPAQSQRLHDDIAECADNLCMTVMFLTSPMNGVDGCMEACGPLLLASMWYASIGDYCKLEWCRQMVSNIESRGIRVQEVGQTPR